MCCKWTGLTGVAAGLTTLAGVAIGDATNEAPNDAAVVATDFQDAQAEATMTADEVLQRAAEASYGEAAEDRSIKRVRITGSFEIAAMGVGGTVETRIDSESGDIISITDIEGMGQESQGITGGVAWGNSTMQGPRLLTDEERAQLARQGNFYAEVDFRETYAEREYLGEEELDGVRCHVVSLTPADGGKPIKRWYNAETGLQLQQEFTIASPMGEVTAVTRTTDYLDIDGIRMPAKTVNTFSGIEQVMTFDSFETNPEFDADAFAIPDEVQELLDEE